MTLFEGVTREGAVGGCRYVVPLHEEFGEVFAALELRALGRGADEHYLFQSFSFGEVVGNACHKRCFGTYDDHCDAVVGDEFAYLVEVVDFEVDIGAALRGAGIAGGDEELAAEFTLCYLGGHGMFAATGTDEKDVHIFSGFF